MLLVMRHQMVVFASVFSLAISIQCSLVRAGAFEVQNARETRQIRAQQKAIQFLSHATFGPRQDEIDRLKNRILQVGTRRACEEWIDEQFSISPTLHVDTINRMLADHGFDYETNEHLTRYRYHAFYHNALRAPDQLQQRVAWALSQIFVISDQQVAFSERALNRDGIPHWLGPSHYYDLLLQASTGTYRDLLHQVSLHPVMGVYLSHLRNSKPDPENNLFPDENYAREVMQLFSIGLYELRADGRPKLDDAGNLIPTYDNETITNLARVFTGLTFSRAEYFGWGDPRDYISPMEMWEMHHDSDAKTLVSGKVLPAHSGQNGDGMRDIRMALDDLAEHQNVAPFIAYRLIQRLVRSNPSRGYIRRVARVFESSPSGVRGDFKSVVKAILLDPEAWRGVRTRRLRNPTRIEIVPRGTEFSRLREPMLRYLAIIRSLEAESFYQDAPSPWAVMSRTDWDVGQSPFGSPSVFNFYLPNYQPPGTMSQTPGSRRLPIRRLVGPEFQLMTPVMNNRFANRVRWEILNAQINFDHWMSAGQTRRSQLRFNFDDYVERIVDDPEAVIDELNWLLCRGTLGDDVKQSIIESIEDVVAQRPWLSDWHRFTSALYCIVCTPEFAIDQ